MSNAAHSPAGQRLVFLDEMLLACGWAQQGDGWKAPEHLSEALAKEVGSGAVSRWIAIGAQVQADEQFCAAVAKATGSAS